MTHSLITEKSYSTCWPKYARLLHACSVLLGVMKWRQHKPPQNWPTLQPSTALLSSSSLTWLSERALTALEPDALLVLHTELLFKPSSFVYLRHHAAFRACLLRRELPPLLLWPSWTQAHFCSLPNSTEYPFLPNRFPIPLPAGTSELHF